MSVDTRVHVGSVELRNPVMTASGTAGYADELASFFDLSTIGAMVVKSLAAFEWAGNPAPRLHPTPQGMLNAVGLQGPGIEHWLADDLPRLLDRGATVVASIWGRTVDEYRRAARTARSRARRRGRRRGQPLVSEPRGPGWDLRPRQRDVGGRDRRHRRLWPAALGEAQPEHRPHRRGGRMLFARSVPKRSHSSTRCSGWWSIHRRDALRSVLAEAGCRVGAIHPIAVRAVHDVRQAHPDLPIVGVGGVASGWDAAEMMLVGADAIQVGTATFEDPAAPCRVLDELVKWADAGGIRHLADLSALA